MNNNKIETWIKNSESDINSQPLVGLHQLHVQEIASHDLPGPLNINCLMINLQKTVNSTCFDYGKVILRSSDISVNGNRN